ncbi:MAG: T9SS type A sorting domain-containing protein [Ignavibacteriaceae bacterium]
MKSGKKIILIIGFCFVTNHTQPNFSYFPLQTGNKWFFSRMPTTDESILTILEANNDTLMSDGKTYTRIDRFDRSNNTWTKQGGYYFLREENNILYNFPKDTLLDYNWNDSTYSRYEVHVEDIIVFSENRLTYFLYIYNPYEYISYTDSIGFNALHALEWNDWLGISRYLAGCIIDNKTYGSIITDINYQNNTALLFSLSQNYPNPFNPTTKIEYSIPKTSFVKLKVYDILGKEVITLVNEEKSIGNYSIEFNGNNLSSGIYFYKIQAGNYSSVKKIILLK